jgi:hypothetical protein
MAIYDTFDVKFISCIFTKSMSTKGGVILASELATNTLTSSLVMENCIFENNTSSN